MKLCNFASLDPKITETGRKGLAGASKPDRTLYAEFGHDWTGLVGRAETLWQSQVDPAGDPQARPGARDERAEFRFDPCQGASTTQTFVEQRVGQTFFRRAVLTNYEERCAITGIADPPSLFRHSRAGGNPSIRPTNIRDFGASVAAHSDRQGVIGHGPIDRHTGRASSRQLHPPVGHPRPRVRPRPDHHRRRASHSRLQGAPRKPEPGNAGLFCGVRAGGAAAGRAV